MGNNKGVCQGWVISLLDNGSFWNGNVFTFGEMTVFSSYAEAQQAAKSFADWPSKPWVSIWPVLYSAEEP